MNRIKLLPLLLLGACASASSSVVTARTPATLRVDSQGGTKEVSVGAAAPIALADNLVIGADSAWRRLPQAFAALGLEGPVPMQAERSLTFGPTKVTRRLGGQRLSTYLNCGQALSAPNADTHSVMLTVSSRLVPNGSVARIETLVQANATPIVSGGATVSCNSTGVLENRLVAEMRK